MYGVLCMRSVYGTVCTSSSELMGFIGIAARTGCISNVNAFY